MCSSGGLCQQGGQYRLITSEYDEESEARTYTAVAALDKAVVKFRREGAEVEVLGLNEASATIVDRFGVHDKPDAVERLMAL